MKVCNVCGSDNTFFRQKYRIRRFNPPLEIAQCENCSLIFQFPQPTDVESYYNEGYYKGENKYSYIDEREDKFLRDIEVVRRIAHLVGWMPDENIENMSLLDVGCSFGSLVSCANHFDIKAKGIDISPYSVAYAEEQGLDVSLGDICTIDGNVQGEFAAITMVEVFEHLTNPRQALINCNRMLKENGIVLIQTTNMDSVVRCWEGHSSRYFLPGHLFYFSRRTLTRLLRQTGFDVVQVYFGHETGLLPAIIRKSICNLGRFQQWPDWLVLLYTTLAHMLSKVHAGGFAVHNGMVVIARKVEGIDGE
jgi:2-polyprenyl-3-methyl-5-hydroxy-6-metoxy-1,4-benzoquinol methylase